MEGPAGLNNVGSWSLFGYPKYEVPYYNRDPKRDDNFDNHPRVCFVERAFVVPKGLQNPNRVLGHTMV